jgi:hypothetical protein
MDAAAEEAEGLTAPAPARAMSSTGEPCGSDGRVARKTDSCKSTTQLFVGAGLAGDVTSSAEVTRSWSDACVARKAAPARSLTRLFCESDLPAA